MYLLSRVPPLALLILAACLNTACTSPAGDLADSETSETKAPAETSALPPRPFPTETLNALLVAEFAGARNQPDVALKNYSEQAQQTRDPGIARRATLIAQYLGASQNAVDNAELWSSIEPASAEPDAVLAAEMLKQNKLFEAYDYSLKLLDKGYQPPFQSIAAQAATHPAEQQRALLERFNETLKKYPGNSSLLLGKALLLHFLGENKQAMALADQAITADKNNSAAYMFQASLLEKAGDRKKAADVLGKRQQRQPYDQRVHLQYARLLASYDLPAAQKEFKLLVDKNPFNAELLLTLAIISKEVGDKASAKEYFEQLLFMQKHQSSAYFYLGQISEDANDTARALESYRRVSDGPDYFYAMAAFCRLTIKEGNLTQCLQHLDEERLRLPDTALKLFVMEAAILLDRQEYTQSVSLLNKALKQFPNDLDLLYSRSTAQEQLGKLAECEADLRAILKIDADNANALNALGYVLANKTDRLQEAHDLITRALALEPENPAILDSMGWVLYRLSRRDEALPYLRKAMALFPNHEIAAHYGEVLWVSGQQKDAREVWKQGIDDKPDSKIIKETLQRLNAK